jgi:hypothetical protein
MSLPLNDPLRQRKKFCRSQETPKSAKQQRWEEAEQQAEKITDGLGKIIDAGIKETVIALKVHGFVTIGSCEGHLDHGLPYPWIDIESPLAENNLSNPRFQQLRKKYMRERQGREKMNEEERTVLIKMAEQQIKENYQEYKRLKELLEEFYKSEDKHGRGKSSLIVKKGFWNQGRLQTASFPEMKVSEIKPYLSQFTVEQNAKSLRIYSAEMDRFTDFLKDKYWLNRDSG